MSTKRRIENEGCLCDALNDNTEIALSQFMYAGDIKLSFVILQPCNDVSDSTELLLCEADSFGSLASSPMLTDVSM